MRIALRHQQRHLEVALHPEGDGYRVSVDGKSWLAHAERIDDATLLLTVDDRRYRITLVREGRNRTVAVCGEVYTFSPDTGGAATHDLSMVAAPEITAPMPGKVLQVLVKAGDRVQSGDGLLILEAMKMETRITAEAAARVAEVCVHAGDMVNGGQVLLRLVYDRESAPLD